MGLTNNYNIYGFPSDRSLINEYPKDCQETWSDFRTQLQTPDVSGRRRSSSFSNMPPTSYSLDAIMQEFRLNGLDSPYDPEEDTIRNPNKDVLIGMGPSSQYLRQKSWPAPDASPATRLPRPGGIKNMLPPSVQAPLQQTYLSDNNVLTEEQLRVLSSLPDPVLYSLLRELEMSREAKSDKQEAMECRFCKNNGERPAYYRSHRLRARGRVACPVLRAYRCRRCGARGDRAHTIKYCPLATADERMKSAAMMRSVRLASGRRRAAAADAHDYVVFGETTPTVLTDGVVYDQRDTLDPIWEALEKKLML
ncbi:unnamed protein product, partial [Brenthis ino]